MFFVAQSAAQTSVCHHACLDIMHCYNHLFNLIHDIVNNISASANCGSYSTTAYN